MPYLPLLEEKAIKPMDKELLVKARQVCEGYLDPAGQIYWADKDEKSYWIARLQDKIRQLQEVLSELQK